MAIVISIEQNKREKKRAKDTTTKILKLESS